MENKKIQKIKNLFYFLGKKGALYIFIGNFMARFAAFFGSIFLVRILSKPTYGILTYAENIYSYVYLFAGFGMVNSLLRYIVLAKSPEKKYAYYRYAIQKSTIINIGLIALVAVGALLYPHPEQFAKARWLLPLLLCMIPFQNLMEHSLFTYRSHFSNLRFAAASLVSAVFIIAIRCVGGMIGGLFGVGMAAVTAHVLASFIFCGDVQKNFFYRLPHVKLTKEEKKEASRYSLQYMLTNSIWAIIMLNDIMLLGQLLGDEIIVAEYKVAYVLPASLSTISSAIGVFVGPYFVRHEKDLPWVWRNYKRTILLTAAGIGLVAFVLYMAASPVIQLLYGAEYHSVVPVMRVLLIGAFINSGLRFMTAHLLSSMNRIRYNIFISLCGVIVQITANCLVIPKFGAIGAASTGVVVYLLMAIALLIVFIKIYRLPVRPTAEKEKGLKL